MDFMFDLIPFKKNHTLAKRGELFNHWMDHFFNDEFFSPLTMTQNPFRVDLRETKDAYLVDADLPGMKKEDISIEYNNNYLTITAKREEKEEITGENTLRRERRYGQFQRSFYVTNIEEEKIHASFKDGVLSVTLPKKEKQEPPTRKIDIH